MQDPTAKQLVCSRRYFCQLLLAFGVVLIVLDRLFKVAVFKFGFSFALVGEWLKFSFAPNYFIAFSLPLSPIITKILALAIIWVLIIVIVSVSNQFYRTILILITWGAASNLYDRMIYGFVIDYFDLKYFTVFNLADCLIVVGAALLVLSFWQKNFQS